MFGKKRNYVNLNEFYHLPIRADSLLQLMRKDFPVVVLLMELMGLINLQDKQLFNLYGNVPLFSPEQTKKKSFNTFVQNVSQIGCLASAFLSFGVLIKRFLNEKKCMVLSRRKQSLFTMTAFILT